MIPQSDPPAEQGGSEQQPGTPLTVHPADMQPCLKCVRSSFGHRDSICVAGLVVGDGAPWGTWASAQPIVAEGSVTGNSTQCRRERDTGRWRRLLASPAAALLLSFALTFSSHALVCAPLDRFHDACPLGVAVQLAPPCVAIFLFVIHDPHSPHGRPHRSLTFPDLPQGSDLSKRPAPVDLSTRLPFQAVFGDATFGDRSEASPSEYGIPQQGPPFGRNRRSLTRSWRVGKAGDQRTG